LQLPRVPAEGKVFSCDRCNADDKSEAKAETAANPILTFNLYFFTSFMGCPQQTSCPAPAATTSTLFPQISQRYVSPTLVTTSPPFLLGFSFRKKNERLLVYSFLES
jgi:hypothetical protein